MRSLPASLLLLLAVPACGDPASPGTDAAAHDGGITADASNPDAGPWPAFRNPVDLADLTLAQMASERLGVGTRVACDACHALTRERLQSWLVETQAADAACLGDLMPTTPAGAQAILDCFRTTDTDAWSPHLLGIYATGAASPWFDAVFDLAYGDDAEAWDDWTGRIVMPRGAQPPLTSADFDVVTEWFARGLPELEAVVPDNPDLPGCTEAIGAEVASHVTAMETTGWTAINRDAGINSLGCAGADTAAECLDTYPLSTTQPYASMWTLNAPETKIRLLRTITYTSSYWTRSSADGRFVSHGGGSTAGATVIDLLENREIPADAFYDPGFFPDNSGFVIQGGANAWCRQSLLTTSPTHIRFNEPQCSPVDVVGLYQHLGAANGGDYWTVNGQFVSDNAWGEPTAWFDEGSTDYLTPMEYTGTGYEAKAQIPVAVPYEGDTIISPSAKLLLSRVAGDGDTQSGFTLRALTATPTGDTYDVATPTIARYCVNGGKPAFSYDERWLVYHHWTTANTADVFLLELTTGVSRQITKMTAGQHAVFPHFRSDGWIYFIVKNANGGEVIAASDAALVLGS